MKIVLIGAGAQGRITLDMLKDASDNVLGFMDDSIPQGEYVNGKEVIGKLDEIEKLAKDDCRFIICIGNNYSRKTIAKRLKLDSLYENVIHPSSVILKSASIGQGNMIFAHSFIGSNTKIGNHVIINNGAIVEHDSVIGNFVCIGPGCCTAGRVIINEGAFISAGVTLSLGVKIGKNSIIGAGAVVVKDIPSGVLAYGVPAKVIRKVLPNELWDRLL